MRTEQITFQSHRAALQYYNKYRYIPQVTVSTPFKNHNGVWQITQILWELS